MKNRMWLSAHNDVARVNWWQRKLFSISALREVEIVRMCVKLAKFLLAEIQKD